MSTSYRLTSVNPEDNEVEETLAHSFSPTVHCGQAGEREGDFFGPAVNRVARLLAAAPGGQILVSASAVKEAQHAPGVSFRDLGAYRLRGLPSEEIFQLVLPALPQQFPPLKGHLPSGNLPLSLTSFVDRDQELRQVTQLLLVHRLVTLWGAGGAGKTRLALEVAAGIQPRKSTRMVCGL